MNRSESTSRVTTQLVLAGLLIAASGCSRAADHPDTSRVIVSRAPGRSQDTTQHVAGTGDTARTAALREAQIFYDYGTERPPVTVRDTAFQGPYVADDSVPRMWIATARLKSSATRPANRIIARIRSERAYPALGIASGYNYVVRNSWDTSAASRWVTKIIASDATMKPHILMRDPRRREFTHGMSPLEPRLVRIKVHSTAIGICLDDPSCPTGHCGYY